MILHDVRCPSCGYEFIDFPFPSIPDAIRCFDCGGEVEIVYRPRFRNAQWHEREKCVVYRDRNGKIRYPGRNDQPTPSGYERVEIHSLADMTRFERDHNVTNEAMHYDKGTGNGFESGGRHDGLPVSAPKWDPIKFGE